MEVSKTLTHNIVMTATIVMGARLFVKVGLSHKRVALVRDAVLRVIITDQDTN